MANEISQGGALVLDAPELQVGQLELAFLCERAASDLPSPLLGVHSAALRVRESTQALQRSELPPLPERKTELLGQVEDRIATADASLAETSEIGAVVTDDDEDEDASPAADGADDDQKFRDELNRLNQALIVEEDTHIIREQLVTLRAQAQQHPPHFTLTQRPFVAMALARLARQDPHAAIVVAAAAARSTTEYWRAQRRLTAGTVGAVVVATRALRLL